MLLLVIASCADERDAPDAADPAAADPAAAEPATAEPTTGAVFTAVEEAAGLDFRHVRGFTGAWYMPETMGSGCGWLDYDNDGWLDAYLVQSGPVPFDPSGPAVPNQLFRNQGDGTFRDVTPASGLGDEGYGMGTCFGDVDNDGWIDVMITNFGPNRLYRNRGAGADGTVTFEDVTERAGVGDERWGTGCAFADYDADGDLDLFTVNYVHYSAEVHEPCGRADDPSYCPPNAYGGVSDILYRNRGDGTFEDVSRETGVLDDDPAQGKGLGVVWSDLDNDGDLDAYVANDLTPNYLYRNRGDGSFDEAAVLTGSAYNQEGVAEAGMGVDAGDFDGDGFFDLFMTHFSFETNTLYRNQRGVLLEDWTERSGLGYPSSLKVAFGTGFLDYDNDGDLDLFVANGHISDNVANYNSTESYLQTDQLFENLGTGRYSEVSESSGSYFTIASVGRGTAFGDYDNDGDVDVLISNSDRQAALLRNDAGSRRAWVMLRLTVGPGGRDAVGAWATLEAGGRKQVREVRAGSSYLSQNDPRLHFGLGEQDRVDRLTVRWPNGVTEEVDAARVAVRGLTVLEQPTAGEGTR